MKKGSKKGKAQRVIVYAPPCTNASLKMLGVGIAEATDDRKPGRTVRERAFQFVNANKSAKGLPLSEEDAQKAADAARKAYSTGEGADYAPAVLDVYVANSKKMAMCAPVIVTMLKDCPEAGASLRDVLLVSSCLKRARFDIPAALKEFRAKRKARNKGGERKPKTRDGLCASAAIHAGAFLGISKDPLVSGCKFAKPEFRLELARLFQKGGIRAKHMAEILA